MLVVHACLSHMRDVQPDPLVSKSFMGLLVLRHPNTFNAASSASASGAWCLQQNQERRQLQAHLHQTPARIIGNHTVAPLLVLCRSCA
jgi:hypothetical protein